MQINAKMKVSDLYRTHPEVLPVLKRHGIDLCCGGEYSLDVVARKHGLNLELFLQELTEVVKAA